MDFYYPYEFYDYISVAPESGESCTVEVNLKPQTSTLIGAVVLPPNRENFVEIRVLVLRPPNGVSETAYVEGEWHATGLPLNKGCTAVTPHEFKVPVTVNAPDEALRLAVIQLRTQVKLSLGFYAALQCAESLKGPWKVLGQGKEFTVPTDMETSFFARLRRIGGIVEGTVSDSAGKPVVGAKLGLLYGGASANSGFGGFFSFPRLPYGDNVIGVTNPAGNASVEIIVPATSNVVAGVKMAAEAAAAAATNACNCTPWCAIGYATIADGTTPVYFSGGANPPKVGAANCDAAVVTVTQPNGRVQALRPGTGRHQNSGPNPARGVWKVTSTVCGVTKECSIEVP